MTVKNQVHYTKEQKAVVLKLMAPLKDESITELARETGISGATLYNWRKVARAADEAVPQAINESAKISVTFTMNVLELAEYFLKKVYTVNRLNNGKVFAFLQIVRLRSSQTVKWLIKERLEAREEIRKRATKEEKALVEATALLLLR